MLANSSDISHEAFMLRDLNGPSGIVPITRLVRGIAPCLAFRWIVVDQIAVELRIRECAPRRQALDPLACKLSRLC
jgi:hypothetical protein